MKRAEARQKILKAANKQVAWRSVVLHQRHIQQAVNIVRARRLVSDKVLVAAGFNPVKERGS